MKGLYFVLAGLLVLVVAIAGCVGKQATPKEQPAQLPTGETPVQPPAEVTPAIEGDITAPADSGLQIEQPQSGADENVDLGSLI